MNAHLMHCTKCNEIKCNKKEGIQIIKSQSHISGQFVTRLITGTGTRPLFFHLNIWSSIFKSGALEDRRVRLSRQLTLPHVSQGVLLLNLHNLGGGFRLGCRVPSPPSPGAALPLPRAMITTPNCTQSYISC